MFTRTLTIPTPSAAPGQRWVASALLEAPDVDGEPGEFVAIEAYSGVPGSFSTRHAEHQTGWYRAQFYDDARASHFSNPVQLSGGTAAGMGGDSGSTYGGR